jgi:hypothetical protein
VSIRAFFLKLGAFVLFASFIVLSLMVAAPAVKSAFPRTGQFATALWNFRRLDVYLQVMLIFASSLGVLTFFAGKGK